MPFQLIIDSMIQKLMICLLFSFATASAFEQDITYAGCGKEIRHRTSNTRALSLSYAGTAFLTAKYLAAGASLITEPPMARTRTNLRTAARTPESKSQKLPLIIALVILGLVVILVLYFASNKKAVMKEMLNLNKTLEKKVDERTLELQMAYANLDAERERTQAAYEREKELNEMRKNFIAVISHEFRTPLTVILSSTYLIEAYIKKAMVEKTAAPVQKIQEAVDKIVKYMEDALILNRTEESAPAFELNEIDMKELTLGIVNEFRQTTDVLINFENQAQETVSRTDGQHVRTILTNFLINAIKFSKAGGKVDVIVRENINQIIVDVKDEGMGIDKYDIEKIFKPFYKTSNTMGLISGSGLGLSIAKQCADTIGAEIIVRSEPGKGSTFSIVLNKKDEALLRS